MLRISFLGPGFQAAEEPGKVGVQNAPLSHNWVSLQALSAWINPFSPPSDPAQRLLQGPPAKSKFLAIMSI